MEEESGEIRVYVKKAHEQRLPQGEKEGSRMASRQVSLSVNDVFIELDYFVQGFIDHTISGMLAVLQGTWRNRESRCFYRRR